jgi:uncharacterized protein YndB with AHSA1/START domain
MATGSKHKLVVTAVGEREIVLVREFDAPRALVFEAHGRPEHMRRWWGPARYEMVVAEMDFRPGGAWRFVQRGAGGEEFGFRGTYAEIVAPERIVWTFEFEGMAGHISTETMTLAERDGRTTMTVTAVYASTEDRDGMLQSGMEEGAAEGFDRLEALLATMAGQEG